MLHDPVLDRPATPQVRRNVFWLAVLRGTVLVTAAVSHLSCAGLFALVLGWIGLDIAVPGPAGRA